MKRRPLRSGFCQSGHHGYCRHDLGTVTHPATCACDCHDAQPPLHVDVSVEAWRHLLRDR